jgi:hypothetical protein
MARLDGVNVEKLQGGLQRLAQGTDNHVGYAITLPAGDVKTAVNNSGKGVVLKSVFDAEQLGINESYDSNNEVKLYDQIVEFFRLAPEATLYLFDKLTSNDFKAWLNHNKEIKGYGLNFDYVAATVEPAAPSNLAATIAEHQTIINDFAAENRLIDFAILGPDGMDVFTVDLFSLSAPNVSVCVACEDNSEIVAIGSVLGMLAARKCSENLGSVDIENKPRLKRGNSDFTLTDSNLNRWLSPHLSDGTTVESLSKSTLNGIIAKGYIVVAGYEGYSGYFFENSYTCIDQASDYAFIENNRIWNKAARIVRATLLPRVKSKVKKDPTTGYIAPTTVSYWTTLLEKALNRLITEDEISGFEVFIDPKQVVNSTAPVKVKVSIIADGIVHEFEVALGLTNNI